MSNRPSEALDARLWLRRGLELVRSPARIVPVGRPDEAEPNAELIPCLPAGDQGRRLTGS